MTARHGVPSLEIRIPISPDEPNMRMLRYCLESLREFGGEVGRRAHCVASVGADEPPRDLEREYPWTADYSIDFHSVDREQFRRWKYDATGFDRLLIESDADVVALADADLLFAGALDPAALEAHHHQRLLGFIAHASPFGFPHLRRPDYRLLRYLTRTLPLGLPLLAQTPSERWWQRIFEAAGLPCPELAWQHSGWGLDWEQIYPGMGISNDPAHKHCPAYYNYGLVLGPRRFVERMGETFVDDLETVGRVLDTVFRSQIANTVCFARHRIPCGTLPLNYNFALNVPGDAMRSLNPDRNGEDSDEDIRVFHYIGGRKHFVSDEAVTALLNRSDLGGAWPVFQRKLRIIQKKIGRSSIGAAYSPNAAGRS